MSISSQFLRARFITGYCLLGFLSTSLLSLAFAQTPPRAEAPIIKVGDQWKFEQRDRRTGVKESVIERSITAVSATQIEGLENGGKIVITPDLNFIESPTQIITSEAKALSFPLELGKKWAYKYNFKD